jgi:hypothetical protein
MILYNGHIVEINEAHVKGIELSRAKSAYPRAATIPVAVPQIVKDSVEIEAGRLDVSVSTYVLYMLWHCGLEEIVTKNFGERSLEMASEIGLSNEAH